MGVTQRDQIGVDRILWELDYPHADTPWPNSQEQAAEVFQGVPADQVEKITHTNAERLFRQVNQNKLGITFDLRTDAGREAFFDREHRLTDRRSLPASADRSAEGAKYQLYRTRDKEYVLFCAIGPQLWRNFYRAVDREDLLDEHQDGPVDFGAGAAARVPDDLRVARPVRLDGSRGRPRRPDRTRL